MTTKEAWLDLAERCEKATGPDRELDIRIWMATAGWEFDRIEGAVAYAKNGNWRQAGNYTKFTASLDAITGRIARDLPKTDLQCGVSPAIAWAEITKWASNTEWTDWEGRAKTLPLALCAAYCKARAETADD